MTVATMIATTMGRIPGRTWPLPGFWSSAAATARDTAQVRDREVDLAEQRMKTTPNASMVVPAIWVMMLLRLTAVKKFCAVRLKTMTMIDRPTITGALPRFPPLKFSQSRVPKVSIGSSAARLSGPAQQWSCRSSAPVVIPETFVGWPAVIAWTTSSWVVVRRSKNAGIPSEP